jgi:hypothetical protein
MEVLEQTKNVGNALGCGLFVCTPDGSALTQFLATGERSTHSTCFMETTVREKEAIVFWKDEIIGLEMGIASFSKGESQEVDQEQ